MEFGIASGGVGELVNGIVGIGVGGVGGGVVTGFEVAGVVVGISLLDGTAPGFGEEVVIDVVGEAAGTVVAVLNRFNPAQSVVGGDGGFAVGVDGFGLTVDVVVFVASFVTVAVGNRCDVAKSVVGGDLGGDVIGVDYLGLTVSIDVMMEIFDRIIGKNLIYLGDI
jgi:hypothetical protein